jgi:hypothetical protein
MLAEPEAEIGFLRVALRTAAFAGLGIWNHFLHWPLSRIADRVTERVETTRSLDPDRLRWYETMRALALLSSIVKRERPAVRRRHVVDSMAARRTLTREIERLTGTRLPQP